MGKKITFEEFLNKIFAKYGEDNIDLSLIDKDKFDYSLKQKIRCVKHNIIEERSPKVMLRERSKYVCKKCQFESLSMNSHFKKENRKLFKKKYFITDKEFLDIINKKFNNSISVDANSFTYFSEHSGKIKQNKEIISICEKHGLFKTTPMALLKCKISECPKCVTEYIASKNILNGEERRSSFISDAIKVHGNLYDYSKVDITGKLKKVEIICPKHGSFFQYPSNHIVRQEGCPICGKDCLSAERRLGELLRIRFPNITIISLYHGFLCRQSLDYYLPDYKLAIEYQGNQHFENVEYFNDYRHSFEKRKQLDILKYNKCKEKGIEIIYFTFNKTFENIEYINKVYTDIECMFNYIQEQLKLKTFLK